MPVLASQASLTPYLEEDGLVLALVGEDHMDTPTLAGMEPLPLTVAGVVASAGASLRPIGNPSGRPINQTFSRR